MALGINPKLLFGNVMVPTRHRHNQSFLPLQTRTDVYKYSFVPRTILDWNSLPDTVVNSPSLRMFKLALRIM